MSTKPSPLRGHITFLVNHLREVQNRINAETGTFDEKLQRYRDAKKQALSIWHANRKDEYESLRQEQDVYLHAKKEQACAGCRRHHDEKTHVFHPPNENFYTKQSWVSLSEASRYGDVDDFTATRRDDNSVVFHARVRAPSYGSGHGHSSVSGTCVVIYKYKPEEVEIDAKTDRDAVAAAVEDALG